MSRLRKNSRIRPVRPYWSRTKVLAVTGTSALVLFVAATSWLQRSEQRTIALDPTGPYRIQADAGPVVLTTGDAPELQVDASWFLVGPAAGVTDRSGRPVVVSCDTRFPCRASSRLELPADAAVTIGTGAADLAVNRFDGALIADTIGDGDVHLGVVTGTVQVGTIGGDVNGYGLAARTVDVETTSGEVNLRFTSRPETVRIRSSSRPVTIELPDGAYAVSVDSGSSVVIDVEQAPSADSQLFVTARGPVRIRHNDSSDR